MIRRRLLVLHALLMFLALAAPAGATPPNVPSAATAATELSALTVAAEGSGAAYDRDRFDHWNTVSGACDARETVLVRDGSGVATGSDCQPTSGSWFSAYDSATVGSSSAVDIDHVVPLAEAWRSGANGWSDAQREAFANDLTWPQLIAVSAASNRSKSDQDPSTWQPPTASYDCRYARMWIRVKHRYGLTLQPSEKGALDGMLATC